MLFGITKYDLNVTGGKVFNSPAQFRKLNCDTFDVIVIRNIPLYFNDTN